MTKKETYRAILYFYFQDYIYGLPEDEKRKFIATGILSGVKSLFVTLWLAFKRNRRAGSADVAMPQSPGQKWVFIYGKNNYDATKFLADSNFLFVTDSARTFKTDNSIHVLPLRFSFARYLNFFSLFFYLYRKEGKRALQCVSVIFSALGWLEACEEVIGRYKPKVIVFSNDHSMIPRAFFWAAKRSGIPTVYIQHASISKYMPPLSFDLSLLEGEDAFDKYKSRGETGKVRLIGMPKFDGFLKARKRHVSTTVKTVGIPFNSVDSITRIHQVLSGMMAKLPAVQFIIRPHPKDTRDLTHAFKDLSGNMEFSDSRSVSPFDFIAACDLIIAGDTSIHLEAKMLNIHSLYFNFSETTHTYDLYGYIKRGFVKEFKTVDDLAAAIEKGFPAHDIFMEARYYNAVVGTPQEGNTKQLVNEELDAFLAQYQ